MEKKRDSFFLANKKQKTDKRPQNGEDKQSKRRDFKKNKVVPENGQPKPEKKPFDKKTYRLKKYSNKYKLEQWEEQRKKKLLREYYKEMKNEPNAGSYKPKEFDEDTTDSNQEAGRFVRHPDLIGKAVKQKKDPFQKAKEHFNKVKQEKLDKQQEIERAKEERKQKIQEYKKKKQEKFKKLSKKTKKGQPVMTGRLELLLDKIQNTK